MTLRHIGLFEGIGGFSLAARWMGWETIAWCEWNEFGQRVLRYHFPKAEGHGDITTTDFRPYRGKCDILTGGFPCQPYSVAGKRLGKEDDRHLWPEMLRAIREIQPKYVVGENVGGLVSWNDGMVFDEVQIDLETQGYEVQSVILPAVSVGAWHRRDRVWFIAHRIDCSDSPIKGKKKKKNRLQKIDGQERCARKSFGANNTLYTDRHDDTNNRSQRNQGSIEKKIPRLKGLSRCKDGRVYARIEGRSDLSTPVLCRSYDGIPDGVDRVTAYGNAIVPQVALQIFKSIEKYEELCKKQV